MIPSESHPLMLRTSPATSNFVNKTQSIDQKPHRVNIEVAEKVAEI